MGGAFGEMMMAAIGGVVCFVVIKEVMDGQNTTSWYEKNGPPYRVIDMVKGTNSVNPKPFRHGNTEPNPNKMFGKCVETMGSLPHRGNDIVRTCVKTQELPRNEVVAQKLCGNRLQLLKSLCSRPSFLSLPQSVSSLRFSQYSSG